MLCNRGPGSPRETGQLYNQYCVNVHHHSHRDSGTVDVCHHYCCGSKANASSPVLPDLFVESGLAT